MSEVTIVATVDGAVAQRNDVLAWEDRRIDAAAKRLGVTVPAGAVDDRREVLLRKKIELGSEEITARLRRQVRAADLVARAQVRVSAKRRRSVTELEVAGGSAAGFVDWFERCTAESDEVAMLRACPDHFVIRTDADGRQVVVETTGGSPLPAMFTVDYADTSTLVTPPDDAYPHQIAGVARTANGTPIGGVRHQFRDTADGFAARLTVEFPLPTPGRMVTAHSWHLACEFSNWVTAAHAQ